MSKLCERDLCASAYSHEEALPIGLRTKTTPRGCTVRFSPDFEALWNLFHRLTIHIRTHFNNISQSTSLGTSQRLPIDSQMWAHPASCTPYWASNETQNRCSPTIQESGAKQESEFRCRRSLCPERRSLHPSASLTSYWTNPHHQPTEAGDESRIPCLCLTLKHIYSHWHFFFST